MGAPVGFVPTSCAKSYTRTLREGGGSKAGTLAANMLEKRGCVLTKGENKPRKLRH